MTGTPTRTGSRCLRGARRSSLRRPTQDPPAYRREARAGTQAARDADEPAGTLRALPPARLCHPYTIAVRFRSTDQADRRSVRCRGARSIVGGSGDFARSSSTVSTQSMLSLSSGRAVRAGPAVARDFFHDGILAFREIVQVVKVLDVLSAVGIHPAELVSARRQREHFAPEIAARSFKPPKHFRQPSSTESADSCRS